MENHGRNRKLYGTLNTSLVNSKRAGVIDCEKQYGILLYLLSSDFLEIKKYSHYLNSYFDGSHARLPKSKMFAIIILDLPVYECIRRKISYVQNNNHEIELKSKQDFENGSGKKAIIHGKIFPTNVQHFTSVDHNFSNIYLPVTHEQKQMQNIAHEEIDNIWDELNHEIETDDGRHQSNIAFIGNNNANVSVGSSVAGNAVSVNSVSINSSVCSDHFAGVHPSRLQQIQSKPSYVYQSPPPRITQSLEMQPMISSVSYEQNVYYDVRGHEQRMEFVQTPILPVPQMPQQRFGGVMQAHIIRNKNYNMQGNNQNINYGYR